MVKTIEDYNDALAGGYITGMGKRSRATRKNFSELAENLGNLDSRFKDLGKTFQKGELISTKGGVGKDFVDLANNILNAAEASKRFAENQQSVAKAIDGTIRSIRKLPYQDLVQALDNSLTGLETSAEERGIQTEQQKDRRKLLSGIDYKELTEKTGAYGATGSFYSRSGNLIAEYKAISEEEQALRKMSEQGFDDYITNALAGIDAELAAERKKELIYERQFKFRQSLLDIQVKALVLQKNEIANALVVAKVGPGSSRLTKHAQVQYKFRKVQDKEQEKRNNLEVAQAAEQAAFDAVQNQITLDNEARALANAEALKQSDIDARFEKDKALKAAKEAVNVATDEVGLAEQLTINAETQYGWDLKSLDIARSRLEFSMERYRIEMALIGIQHKYADPKLWGFDKVRAGRASTRAGMQAKEDIALKGIGYGGRKQMTDAGFTMREALYPERISEERLEQLDHPEAKAAYDAMMGHLRDYKQISGDIKIFDEEAGVAAQNKIKAEMQLGRLKMEQVNTWNPAEVAFLQAQQAHYAEFGHGFTAKQAEEVRALSKAQADFNIQLEFAGSIQDALKQGFRDMFMILINETESFNDAIKAVLENMLQMMAEAFMQMAVQKMMMGMGFREGGIFTQRGSGGYKSFAGGGIASGPAAGYGAVLHGTEAVVPLGNDKAIPVEFKGGGASVSNVTVNVSASGGQQTTTSKAGERERKLGQMIAAAVQGELLDQQRPGGILSPYGDGGV
jgi:hypothetical protein